MRVVGRPHPRIDGPSKTTGRATYAYEHHDVVTNPAYGVIVGSAIAKGRVESMNLTAAQQAPGVISIVTAQNAGKLGKGKHNTAKLLGGPRSITTIKQLQLSWRKPSNRRERQPPWCDIEYARAEGRFDLEEALKTATLAKDPNSSDKEGPPESRIGDFEQAFAQAAVKLDQHYTTPDDKVTR